MLIARAMNPNGGLLFGASHGHEAVIDEMLRRGMPASAIPPPSHRHPTAIPPSSYRHPTAIPPPPFMAGRRIKNAPLPSMPPLPTMPPPPRVPPPRASLTATSPGALATRRREHRGHSRGRGERAHRRVLPRRGARRPPPCSRRGRLRPATRRRLRVDHGVQPWAHEHGRGAA